MFRLWRQFVKWMRSIALKLKDGKPVNWGLKFQELMAIVAKGLKQVELKGPSEPIKPEESVKPVEPKIPDYDLIGPKKRKRWWWR